MKFVNVSPLVKDKNWSDSILVNTWQIRQFWKSDHDTYPIGRMCLSLNMDKEMMKPAIVWDYLHGAYWEKIGH
jgi:hypothetical protein